MNDIHQKGKTIFDKVYRSSFSAGELAMSSGSVELAFVSPPFFNLQKKILALVIRLRQNAARTTAPATMLWKTILHIPGSRYA